VASVNFKPTPSQPFRLATSWRWQDYKCPMREITLQGFCKVAAKLDITRVLILGDSLSIQFGISMLSLLGSPPRGRQTSFNAILKPFTIRCNNITTESEVQEPHSFDVKLWIYRRSPIDDFIYLNKESESNDTLANDQRNFVQDNLNCTVIIANTGAWMKGIENYTFAFHSILNWIDSLRSSNKILTFYRPTIPGHFHCEPNAPNIDNIKPADFNWTETVHQKPFLNYEEYHRKTNEILSSNEPIEEYNWLEFESYNLYSKSVIENRMSEGTNIHWLNIFNSSVLRQDGHVGFNDCLHALLPPYWWVHFFYSALWDISNNNIFI
jgi:hypothetical protein